jgi:spermidine synthase
MLFAVTAMFFVPLGAMVGQELTRFRPLAASTLGVLGGLAGIACFALVIDAGNPPWMWFALGFAVLAVAAHRHPYFELGIVATMPIAIALVLATAREHERWSPYARIDWYRASTVEYAITLNGSATLAALDMSDQGAVSDPLVASARDQYRAPLGSVAPGDTALVLAAGPGNVVALLLAQGAGHVDAVEIDPVLIHFGRTRHYQRPYGDPRVDVHDTDIRAFLRQTSRTYDLVVLGSLAGRPGGAGMGALPPGSFDYTQHAIDGARRVLTPGGRLVLYQRRDHPQLAAKLFRMLVGSFEAPPEVFHWPRSSHFAYAFVAAGAIGPVAPAPAPRVLLPTDVDLPTDDWPYFYLVGRTIPPHDLAIMALVVVLATLLVLGARGGEVRGAIDATMFCAGSGFMLLASTAGAGMSLLFGSAWQVTLFSLASLLLVILAANVLARRHAIPLRPVLGFLLVSLGLGLAVPVTSLADGSLSVERTARGVLVTAPIVLAALASAILLGRRSSGVPALAYASLGAAAGGVFGYAVLVSGIRMLNAFAAVCYVLVWMMAERWREPAAAPP